MTKMLKPIQRENSVHTPTFPNPWQIALDSIHMVKKAVCTNDFPFLIKTVSEPTWDAILT